MQINEQQRMAKKLKCSNAETVQVKQNSIGKYVEVQGRGFEPQRITKHESNAIARIVNMDKKTHTQSECGGHSAKL